VQKCFELQKNHEHFSQIQHSKFNIQNFYKVKLGEDLQKRLSKKFEPSTVIESTYKGKDMAFKTDSEGNATFLFIGKRDERGIVKGQRFQRVLIKDSEGNIIKDHWDNKGKAT